MTAFGCRSPAMQTPDSAHLEKPMAKHRSMLDVGTNDITKALATEAMRLRCVVIDQGVPLEMEIPNAATRAAMEESRALLAARRACMVSAEALEKNGHQ